MTSNGKVKSSRRQSKGQASTAPKAGARRSAGRNEASVAGVHLSSPDRVLYPDIGLTKLGLAEYYLGVAELILPFIADRPLSTVRCPQGRTGQCFFQKHLRETFREPVRSIRVEESSGPAEYIAVDSVEGLITLVQFGVLEIHPWGSVREHLDRPDTLTFDLDPGEGVDFESVRDAAAHVREVLEVAGLEPLLKTTGGKGLHVVVPIEPDAGWDEAKAFCAEVAKSMTREDPERYIATASKAKRRGKVFIDYLRNSRGATSIAPYSTRARARAPVAMPLRWDELSKLDRPDAYRVDNVKRRLSALKRMPWEDLEDRRRSLAGVVAEG